MAETKMWVTAVTVTAIVLAGLLSGVELGTGLAHQTAQALPEAAWTAMHQAEDRLFRIVIPPAFLLTILLLAATAVLTRGTTRVCFIVAAILTAIEVIATVVLNVPLNNQVQTWTAGSAPADWAHVRDTWLRNHWARSVVGLLGFVSAVAGAVIRR